MKKLLILPVLVILALMSISMVMAQDNPTGTPEGTDEATQEADSTMNTVETTRVRIAYLGNNAPDARALINGEDIGIQALSSPDITGWVEIPYTNFTFEIEANGEAVVGPTRFTPSAFQWITIVISGSENDMEAHAIYQNYETLPAGCAQVTVFNAVQDSYATVSNTLGEDFITNLGLASATASNADQTNTGMSVLNDCFGTSVESGTTGSISLVDDLTCRRLNAGTRVMMDDAEATVEPDVTAEATSDATAMTSTADADVRFRAAGQQGGIFTCAYSVLVPANSPSFQITSANGTNLGGIGDNVTENMFIFAAVYGTADNPQLITERVAFDQVSGMVERGENGS